MMGITMAQSRVNRNNFINIAGWMLTDLDLKGNELIIYACIYGFSQAENQSFSGSLQYLADWTNSTKQGVLRCLQSLVEKGYIDKKDNIVNGVKFCEYRATNLNGVLNKVEQGIKESLTPPIKQSLPNNTSLYNIEDNIEKKKERKQTTMSSFDKIFNAYTDDKNTIDLLQEWLKVRKAKRAAMTDRSIKLNIDKLDGFAKKSNLSVAKYLEEVIARGWAAFYPINQFGSSKTYGATGVEIKPNNDDDLDGIL